MDTILIFGKTGLLGNCLYNYLKNIYNVYAIDRNEFEINNDLNKDKLKDFILNYNPDLIINCIGITNKFNYDQDFFNLINSEFPKILSEISEELGIKFIYPSTDCVFNGKLIYPKTYNEDDIPNAEDFYGKSKILAEQNIKYGSIIRCSIIGFDDIHKRGLIEWVKNSKNEINGYENHYWNGITALEYAKVIEQIIDKNLFWNGIKHIVPNYQITKYELVNLIIKTYNYDIKVNKVKENNNNKLLSTKYNMNIEINNLETQLKQLL